ncbi:twin-arginine translocation signal domain-containing protein [Halorussus amylolyticus]|uniref:twin-arginine translocation signal domain-containing protein n=1 Tax=Halorussus amylolyticus TaxID=1126242 RepID=UPI00104AA63F|nr:twin-arginine translocation signal domain-containing protein [Halorussus amylolyticus]
MTRRYTRRQFLGASSVVGLAGASGCSLLDASPSRSGTDGTRKPTRRETSEAETTASEEILQSSADPIDVRGALYVPSRAWNTYQMWADYDESVVERDLGYAERVNLNAVRTWVSYERWEEDPDTLERDIDHFLQAADDRGIRAVLGLFESVGKEPTEENLTNTDPLTAPPCQSPSSTIIKNSELWDEPREYVRWFMDRWRDDDRLLAVESMNEPGWLPDTKSFAGDMFETMAEERGSVPLTVGSTSLANNAEYVDLGCDIFQFHYNFPNDTDIYRDLFADAKQLGDDLDVPVWLTEWQRVANYGWGGSDTVEQWQPDYASLAPTIHEHGVGNFFWSLMVKPAYVRYMRKRGIINGLFHEDGTVWNAEDAKAIKAMSGDPEIAVEQRREWPQWAEPVREHAHGK